MPEAVATDVEFELLKLERQKKTIEIGRLNNEIRLTEIERERRKCVEGIDAADPALRDIEKQMAELRKLAKEAGDNG